MPNETQGFLRQERASFSPADYRHIPFTLHVLSISTFDMEIPLAFIIFAVQEKYYIRICSPI